MIRVLVVATSKKTRGGITAVLKLYEQSQMWRQYHCRWIGTHRDGGNMCKLWYFATAFMQYLVLLPFYDIVHIHFSLKTSAKRKYPFFRLAKLFDKNAAFCGAVPDYEKPEKYWDVNIDSVVGHIVMYANYLSMIDELITGKKPDKNKDPRHLANSEVRVDEKGNIKLF